MAQENKNPESTNEASAFGIEKLYVKDASIEVPGAPQIFTERTMPEINVELGNAAQQVDSGIFDVSIKVTVTAKLATKQPFWLK